MMRRVEVIFMWFGVGGVDDGLCWWGGGLGGYRGVALRPGGSRHAGGDLVKWMFLRAHPQPNPPCMGGSHNGGVVISRHPIILRINEVYTCVRHESVADTPHPCVAEHGGGVSPGMSRPASRTDP